MTEEEAKQSARRAYNKDSALTSSEIGKAIGRSRQTVDSYIAALRAVNQMGINIKIFRMNRLGISQGQDCKEIRGRSENNS
ncbi:MAG: HTH domain-containing protein [Thermodesulfobacteriota bacterium]|nr:HTH domain-containing protein [Thermodesulfobacteriota bacterium]